MASYDAEDLDDEIIEPEDLFMNESYDDSIKDDGSDNEVKKKGKDKKSNKNNEDLKKVQKKRKSGGKRVKLDLNSLMAPNGLQALQKSFKNFHFKGHNHEKEDLTKIMEILHHWMCYRLFPSSSFERIMLDLENLGSKKNLQTYMKKIRLGIESWGEQQPNNEVIQGFDTENQSLDQNNFDAWLQQQMATVHSDDDYDNENSLIECTMNENHETSPEKRQKTQEETGTSSLSSETTQRPREIILTPEQLERIARNKKLAEERRLKRLSEQIQQMPVNEH